MKKPIILLSSLALAISLPVSSALADTAIVTAEKSANIRAGAGMNHPVIGWAMKGDTLETAGTSGNWTRVLLKGGKEGYIYTALLTEGTTGGSGSVGSSATITAEVSANVRAEASSKGEIIGWAMKGDKVTILDKTGSWCKVQLKNGKVGYIHASFIGGASSEGGSGSVGSSATITAEVSANVRAEASSKAKIIGWAMKGDKVTVLDKTGNWCKVQLKNGKVGYIHASFIGGASSEGGSGSVGSSATITAEVSANVRAEASSKAKIIGWAMKGDKVTVLDKTGSWCKVQLKNGKVGYIHASFIGGASSEGGSGSVGSSATITAEVSANVRAEASSKGEIIGWAMKGDKVTILDKTGSWYKVQLKNGKVGYIHSDYCAG